MVMISVAESLSRQSQEKAGIYLTDIDRLNEIYRAAKRVVAHPDKTGLAALAQALNRAERAEK